MDHPLTTSMVPERYEKSMAQTFPLNTSDFQIQFKHVSFKRILLMTWAQCELFHE